MSSIFGIEFFPTPPEVIERMLEGYSVENKVILEPSAGSGNIVDYCKLNGAKEVIACENHTDLQKILATKCKIVCNDFMELTSDKISHIHAIIMNPPFSCADKHILHAWEIAPAGCTIISLCNSETIRNGYSKTREQLRKTIEEYGHTNELGDCFSTAERVSEVNVNVVRLQKPGTNADSDFNGFFLEDDEPELHADAIMSYNVIRDLVQRYIYAIKLYDKQLELGVEMNELTSTFYSSSLGFSCTVEGKPKLRNDYKKDLQKAGWNFIFNKMDMRRHMTQGLKNDINKFVEQQVNIPFTMKNIYHMLDAVIQTTGQRMDKALVEVFDNITKHHDENRFGVEGWKTNSHYLLNKMFIDNWVTERGFLHGELKIRYRSGDTLDDLTKALCYITGDDYNNYDSLDFAAHNKEWGKWFDWGFFECRGYKKGTMHFKFKDLELWGKFNQNISRIKGYPLFEYKGSPPKPQPVPEPIISPTAVAVYMTPNYVVCEVSKQEAVKQEVYQPELF